MVNSLVHTFLAWKNFSLSRHRFLACENHDNPVCKSVIGCGMVSSFVSDSLFRTFERS